MTEKLKAAAASLRATPEISPPPFEFLEGPRATRAAFFGLVGWVGAPLGLRPPDGARLAFGTGEFLALFAAIVVDLAILFLTLARDPAASGSGASFVRVRRAGPTLPGDGSPEPPILDTIFAPPDDGPA